MNEQSIGMFDSGVGGLTVLSKLIRFLTTESVIYLADTANVPYGNKSPEEIVELSLKNAAFLMQKNIKLLVVACHTASSYALSALRAKLKIPVVSIIPETLKMLFPNDTTITLAIIGTKATIASKVYPRLIKKEFPNFRVFSSSCPLLPSLIEEGCLTHAITKEILAKYLHRFEDENVDALFLGCTHFPLIKELIQQEIGEKVRLIDPANIIVERIKIALIENNLCASDNNVPTYQYFATKDEEKFLQFKDKLLNQLLVAEKIGSC